MGCNQSLIGGSITETHCLFSTYSLQSKVEPSVRRYGLCRYSNRITRKERGI